MLCLVRYLFVISTSVIDWLGRFVPEMTYYVSSGTFTKLKLKLSLQTLFAENKEKMINATLSALLDRDGDQNLAADELEEQFHAIRRLVASKAGFGAFISLPQ